MPIRPELRNFYGTHWREVIRPRILVRAHNRCEQCHVPNHVTLERGARGVWRLLEDAANTCWRNCNGSFTTFIPVPESRRHVRIVLTIAHLNHKPGDDRNDNLKALCQWCHLHHDQTIHARNAHATRAIRKDRARPLLTGDRA